MPRNAIVYVHPKRGEMWIQRGSDAAELYAEKNWGQLNELLDGLWRKCYGS